MNDNNINNNINNIQNLNNNNHNNNNNNNNPINNLKPFTSGERAREAARQGGHTFGKRVQKRKTCQDVLQMLLATEIPSDMVTEYLGRAGQVLNKDITFQDAIMMRMQIAALDGDVKAAAFVRDTAGDAPTQKIQAAVTDLSDQDRAELDQLRQALLSDED